MNINNHLLRTKLFLLEKISLVPDHDGIVGNQSKHRHTDYSHAREYYKKFTDYLSKVSSSNVIKDSREYFYNLYCVGDSFYNLVQDEIQQSICIDIELDKPLDDLYCVFFNRIKNKIIDDRGLPRAQYSRATKTGTNQNISILIVNFDDESAPSNTSAMDVYQNLSNFPDINSNLFHEFCHYLQTSRPDQYYGSQEEYAEEYLGDRNELESFVYQAMPEIEKYLQTGLGDKASKIWDLNKIQFMNNFYQYQLYPEFQRVFNKIKNNYNLKTLKYPETLDFGEKDSFKSRFDRKIVQGLFYVYDLLDHVHDDLCNKNNLKPN